MVTVTIKSLEWNREEEILQDTEGIYVSHLHYEFTKSEFEALRLLTSTSASLTANELRRIDGILAERQIEPSRAEILLEIVSHLNSQAYLEYLLYGVSVVSIFGAFYISIFKLKWPKISYTFLIRISFVIVIIGLYCWECKLAIEIEEKKTMEKVYDEVYPTWYSYQYWFPTGSKKPSFINDRSVWEVLHPATIVSRLSSRFIYTPVEDLLVVISKFAEYSSNKFIWPLSVVVNVVLLVLFFCIAMSILFAFFWSFIFGRSLTFGMFGGMFGLKLHRNEGTQYRRVNETESKTDDTIKSLTNLVWNLASRNTQQQPAIVFPSNRRCVDNTSNARRMIRSVVNYSDLRKRRKSF